MKGIGRGKPAIADSPQPFTIQVKKKGILSNIGKMNRETLGQRKILENAKNIGQRSLENAQASIKRSSAMNSELDQGMDTLNKKMRGLKGFSSLNESLETKGLEDIEEKVFNPNKAIEAAKKTRKIIDGLSGQINAARAVGKDELNRVAPIAGTKMDKYIMAHERVVRGARAAGKTHEETFFPSERQLARAKKIPEGVEQKGIVSETLEHLRPLANLSDDVVSAGVRKAKKDIEEPSAQRGVKTKSVGSHVAAAGAGALAGGFVGAALQNSNDEREHGKRSQDTYERGAESYRKLGPQKFQQHLQRLHDPKLSFDEKRDEVRALYNKDAFAKKIQVAKPHEGRK
jgi:hypothetical protein